MESILEECEELPTRISVSHICQNLSVKGDIIIYAHNTEIIFADTIGEITKKSSDPIGTIQQVRMCSLPSICIVVVTTDVGIQALDKSGAKPMLQYPSPNQVQTKVDDCGFYRGISALELMEHIFLVVGTSTGDILFFKSKSTLKSAPLPKMELLRKINCHDHAVCSAESTLSGSFLATSDEYGTVILYDPNNDFDILHRINGAGYSVTTMRFLNDDWLVCGHLNGLVHFHKTSDAKLYARLAAHARALTAMDSFGMRFITVGEDTFMNVWELNISAEMPEVELLESKEIQDEILVGVAFDSDTRMVYTASYDNTYLRSWKVEFDD